MNYTNYIIWSEVAGKYLTADYATGNYSDGFTKKMSRAIIFDNETQAKYWWDSKLLCEPLFDIKEI